MKNHTITKITPSLAEAACRSITKSLPEWFGLPNANEKYAKGMLERTSFAAVSNDNYVGLITLEFHYPGNCNIYWIAVDKNYHGQKIGAALLNAAENFSREQGCDSMTVETVSPNQGDENYLKTYNFYIKSGFKPLFEMNTYDQNNLMVYLYKSLV